MAKFPSCISIVKGSGIKPWNVGSSTDQVLAVKNMNIYIYEGKNDIAECCFQQPHYGDGVIMSVFMALLVGFVVELILVCFVDKPPIGDERANDSVSTTQLTCGLTLSWQLGQCGRTLFQQGTTRDTINLSLHDYCRTGHKKISLADLTTRCPIYKLLQKPPASLAVICAHMFEHYTQDKIWLFLTWDLKQGRKCLDLKRF